MSVAPAVRSLAAGAAGVAVTTLLASSTVAAAPRLTSADVRVTFHSAASCEAIITLRIDDAATVTQHIEVAEGASVALVEVSGAEASPPTDVGRTRVLVTRSDSGVYTLRYAVRQAAHRPGRCPLWVPTIPADGRSAAVRLTVRIPPGTRAAGTMPAFAWAGEEGTAAIGHLPAFVRVPFAAPGEPAPWNIARLMDIVSIATLALATLAWARRRGDRHH